MVRTGHSSCVRNWKLPVVAALFAGAMLPSVGEAWPPPSRVSGDWSSLERTLPRARAVRIRTRTGGVLFPARAELASGLLFLEMSAGDGQTWLDSSEVERIDIRWGGAQDGAIGGAVVTGLAGAALFAAYASAMGGTTAETVEVGAVGGLLGAAAGAVAGAFLGELLSRWKPIYRNESPARIDIGSVSPRDPSLGVVVARNF